MSYFHFFSILRLSKRSLALLHCWHDSFCASEKFLYVFTQLPTKWRIIMNFSVNKSRQFGKFSDSFCAWASLSQKQFTHFWRINDTTTIYTLYLESVCTWKSANRKVFTFLRLCVILSVDMISSIFLFSFWLKSTIFGQRLLRLPNRRIGDEQVNVRKIIGSNQQEGYDCEYTCFLNKCLDWRKKHSWYDRFIFMIYILHLLISFVRSFGNSLHYFIVKQALVSSLFLLNLCWSLV